MTGVALSAGTLLWRRGGQGASAPVPRAPVAVDAPRITGSGRIGEALTASTGRWDGYPAPRLARQWLRDGVAIPEATAPSYRPGPEDDLAEIACAIEAANVLGAVTALSAAVRVTQIPPAGAGDLTDISLSQNSGVHHVNAFSGFTGAALNFSVTGDGVSIDPETGILSILTGALLSGVEVTVTATNSGGTATGSFRLTVAAIPPVEPEQVAPEGVTPPTLAGSGVIGTEVVADPGGWTGTPVPEITYQWLRDGVAIEGATDETYLSAAEDDGAELSVKVTATNAAGAASAVSAGLAIVQVAPAVTSTLADLRFEQGSGAQSVDTAAGFTGAVLVFSVSGADAGIDPATGVVTIDTGTRRAAEVVTVTATNSGGSASTSFTVSVVAREPEVTGPELVIPPAIAGRAVIGNEITVDPGIWNGTPQPEVGVQWLRDGRAIAEATRLSYVPLPVDDGLALSVRVTAQNVAGTETAETAPVTASYPAPEALGRLPDVAFAAGSGVQTISALAGFAGAGLTFVLEDAPEGVTIDAGAGLVSVATGAPVAATTVTVRAVNSGGTAVQSFTLEVRAAESVFDNTAALGDITFHDDAGAPSWTRVSEGYARLVPAATGGAYGDWSGASGDGLYRTLARWHNPGAVQTQFRPFSFGVNTRKEGRNFHGIRLDVYEATARNRQIQFRAFTGRSNGTLPLGTTATVAWSWDTWYWIEVEVDGAEVRARLYPEGGEAPDWQVAAEVADAAPGGFGPGGISRNGQAPVVDIRRLEFTKPSHEAEIPSAALDSEWDIAQFTERT